MAAAAAFPISSIYSPVRFLLLDDEAPQSHLSVFEASQDVLFRRWKYSASISHLPTWMQHNSALSKIMKSNPSNKHVRSNCYKITSHHRTGIAFYISSVITVGRCVRGLFVFSIKLQHQTTPNSRGLLLLQSRYRHRISSVFDLFNWESNQFKGIGMEWLEREGEEKFVTQIRQCALVNNQLVGSFCHDFISVASWESPNVSSRCLWDESAFER